MAPHREIRGHRFSRRMWRENPAASRAKPPVFNQARKDVHACGCFDISMFCIECSSSDNTQNISKNVWKPYMEKKKTFQPFGTQQRIHVLQAGVPALTTSGEPWGNCKAEGCWKSLQWSPPTPYRVHCWPLCPDMYVQKAHVKDQEVFLCCSLHCQYFPPPSSSSYRTTCDL